jgi:MFS family permease
MAAAAGHGGNGGAPAMAVTPVKSMERRASLRRAGAGAAPPAPPDAEKGKARHATPLLLVILWTSMACAFVAGYSSALTRRWLLSLPGVADALSERRCSERTTCTTPDAARTGPSGVLYRAFFSAPSVALLVGAALGAWTLRTRGRRTALMAANATYIAAFVIATAARDYYTLLVGSLVGELASGIVVVAVVVVDAELAPPKKRLVFMTASSTVAFGMGALCASCLALAQIALPSSADNWFWRVMTAFGAWPCFLLLAIVPFVPESPLLLVQRGRTAEALQTLKDLRGPFADVRDEHTGIIHEIAEAQADDARMRRVRAWVRVRGGGGGSERGLVSSFAVLPLPAPRMLLSSGTNQRLT